MLSNLSDARLRKLEALACHAALGVSLMNEVLARLLPREDPKLRREFDHVRSQVRRIADALEAVMTFDEADADFGGEASVTDRAAAARSQAH